MSTSRRRRSTRRLTAAAVLASATLAACGGGGSGGDGGGTDTGTPVPGGTLKIAFWSSLQSCFDPNQVYVIETRSINRNFADSLTDQDPETGKIVPWLAKSWKVNPDATEYTFVLRDGVTFSDGTPLDANAVKTAYDGVHELGAKSPLGLSLLAGYESTTVVDPHTVTVKLSTPNAAFLQATSTTTLAILSPQTYKETPEDRCTGKVVGSGLFELDSYTAGKEIKLHRRDGYAWPSELVENTGAAHVDGIEVSYIAEDSVRVGSLTSKAIDIAWPRLPISSADQEVVKAAGGTIETRSLPGISGLLFPNITGDRPLSDPLVRQALNKAIDRGSYASTVFWEGYPVVQGPYDATTPYAANLSAKLGHDPDGAAKLLDEAGWKPGSDGYRHSGDRKLTLTYLTPAASAGDQLLQDQLKKVGIDLQIKVVTQAQAIPQATAGDYDLTPGYLTRGDPSVLGAMLDSAAAPHYASRYGEEPRTATKISELFARGLTTADPQERGAAYEELQTLLIDEGVVFPLYDRLQVVGLSDTVHGFAWTSEGFLRANDLWLTS
ncbi:ABC transporter substrate-binding protein [Parafrankia sp. FMc6]|uniref:ABC transporter substrate-binding protein n=1 Tax=Parafrankia soli TaxID=2599596 RepID=UPI0034D55638